MSDGSEIILSARAPEEEASAPGCPGWMLTFGDTVSLLMTFFVLILAFSDSSHSVRIMTGYLQKLDPNEFLYKFVGGDVIPDEEDLHTVDKDVETVNSLMDQNNGALQLAQQALKQNLSTVHRAGGGDMSPGGARPSYEVVFTQYVVFSLGAANLWHASDHDLKRVGELLRNIPNDVYISGYAQDHDALSRPVFSSNEALAVARAKAVADFLESGGYVTPERVGLSVAGRSQDAGSARQEGASAVAVKVEFTIMDTFDGYDMRRAIEEKGL